MVSTLFRLDRSETYASSSSSDNDVHSPMPRLRVTDTTPEVRYRHSGTSRHSAERRGGAAPAHRSMPLSVDEQISSIEDDMEPQLTLPTRGRIITTAPSAPTPRSNTRKRKRVETASSSKKRQIASQSSISSLEDYEVDDSLRRHVTTTVSHPTPRRYRNAKNNIDEEFIEQKLRDARQRLPQERIQEDDDDDVLSVDMMDEEEFEPVKPATLHRVSATPSRKRKSLFSTIASSLTQRGATETTTQRATVPMQMSSRRRASSRTTQVQQSILIDDDEELFPDESSVEEEQEESSYDPSVSSLPHTRGAAASPTRRRKRAAASHHVPPEISSSADDLHHEERNRRNAREVSMEIEEDSPLPGGGGAGGERIESSDSDEDKDMITRTTTTTYIASPGSDEERPIPTSRRSTNLNDSTLSHRSATPTSELLRKQALLTSTMTANRRKSNLVGPSQQFGSSATQSTHHHEAIEEADEEDEDESLPDANQTSVMDDLQLPVPSVQSAAAGIPRMTFASPRTPATTTRTHNAPPSTASSTTSSGTSWLQKMRATPSTMPITLGQDETFPSPFSNKNKNKVGKYGKMLVNSVLKIRQSHAQIQSGVHEEGHSVVLVVLAEESYYGNVSLFCKQVDPPVQDARESHVHVFMWRSRFEELHLGEGKHFCLYSTNEDDAVSNMRSSSTGARLILNSHLLSVKDMPEDWSKRKVNAELADFTQLVTAPMKSNVEQRQNVRTPMKKAKKNRIVTPLRGAALFEAENSATAGASRDEADSGTLREVNVDELAACKEAFCLLTTEGTIQRVFPFDDMDVDSLYFDNFVLIQCGQRVDANGVVVRPDSYMLKLSIINTESTTWSQLLLCEGLRVALKRLKCVQVQTVNRWDDETKDMWHIAQSVMSRDISMAPENFSLLHVCITESSEFEVLSDLVSDTYAPPHQVHSMRRLGADESAQLYTITGRLILICPAQKRVDNHTSTLLVYIQDTTSKEMFGVHICDTNMVQYLRVLLAQLEASSVAPHEVVLRLSHLRYSSLDKVIYTHNMSVLEVLREDGTAHSQAWTQALTQGDHSHSDKKKKSKANAAENEVTFPLLSTNEEGRLDVSARDLENGSLHTILLTQVPEFEWIDTLGGSTVYIGCPHCRFMLPENFQQPTRTKKKVNARRCPQCHEAVKLDAVQHFFCIHMILMTPYSEEIAVVLSHEDVLRLLGSPSMNLRGNIELSKVVGLIRKKFPAEGIALNALVLHKAGGYIGERGLMVSIGTHEIGYAGWQSAMRMCL